MKSNTLRLLGAACVTALALSSASAATIFTVDFDGTNIDEKSSFTAGQLASNLTLTTGLISSGAGTKSNSSGTTAWASGYLNGTVAAATVDLATAISNNVYFEFALTPQAGFELDLNGGNLQINYGFSGGSTASRPSNTALMFSATGFTSTDYAVTTGDVANALTTYSIASSALDNLTGTQTFRLYYWTAGGTGLIGAGLNISQTKQISGFAVGESVILDASVASAVPEPSTFAALAGLGVLGFAATRRRRS